MIIFRCDDENCLKQGNKEEAWGKVRNTLREELILAIIAISLSMNLKASGYPEQFKQMFENIKAVRAAKHTKNNR